MDLMGDIYTKAMFGDRAVHVPAWIKIQNRGEQGVLFVGASISPKMQFGSDRCHILMLGEIVARPHMLVASDHLIGSGLSGLAREGSDLDEWAENGVVLFDGLGQIKGKG